MSDQNPLAKLILFLLLSTFLVTTAVAKDCGPCSSKTDSNECTYGGFELDQTNVNKDSWSCEDGCSNGFDLRCPDRFYCSDGDCVSQYETNDRKSKGETIKPVESVKWSPTYSRMSCDLEQCPTCESTYDSTAFEWADQFHYCSEPYRVEVTKNIMSCANTNIRGSFREPLLSKEELQDCAGAPGAGNINENDMEEHHVCLNKKKCNDVDYVGTETVTQKSFVCGQNYDLFNSLVTRFNVEGEYCKAADVLDNSEIPSNNPDQKSDTINHGSWSTEVKKRDNKFQKVYNDTQNLSINFNLENQKLISGEPERVTLSRVKVDVEDDGTTVSTKKGIYGAKGSTDLDAEDPDSAADFGMIRNIDLPDPGDQFHETYQVSTEFESYRGWTGRRLPENSSISLLGDAIRRSVNEQSGMDYGPETFVSDILKGNSQTVQCVLEPDDFGASAPTETEEFIEFIGNQPTDEVLEECGIGEEEIIEDTTKIEKITTNQRKSDFETEPPRAFLTIIGVDTGTGSWKDLMGIQDSTLERCLSNWDRCFFPGNENLMNAGAGPEQHSQYFRNSLRSEGFTSNPKIVEKKEISIGKTGIVDGNGNTVSYTSPDRPVVITNSLSEDKLHHSRAEYLARSGDSYQFEIHGCNPRPDTKGCSGSIDTSYLIVSPRKLERVEGMEAGTVRKPATGADHTGNVVKIDFKDSYDDPMVFTTVQTENGDHEPKVVSVEKVDNSKGEAYIEFCEPFGEQDYTRHDPEESAQDDRCGSHAAEDIGYLVIDESRLTETGLSSMPSIEHNEDFPMYGGETSVRSAKEVSGSDDDSDGYIDDNDGGNDCDDSDSGIAMPDSGAGCGDCEYDTECQIGSFGINDDTTYCKDGSGGRIDEPCCTEDGWFDNNYNVEWDGCVKPNNDYEPFEQGEKLAEVGFIPSGTSKAAFFTEIQSDNGGQESTIAMAVYDGTQGTDTYTYDLKFCEPDLGPGGAEGYGVPSSDGNINCNQHTSEVMAWLGIPRFSGTQELTATVYEYADDGSTYDGANAEVSEDTGRVKVFKDCQNDENWLVGNNPGDSRNFLCVSQNMSQEYYSQPYSKTTAYNCFDEDRQDMNSDSYQESYIDYMDISEENHTYYYDGDYYTCKENSGEWVVDSYEPYVRCDDCISKQEAEVNERIDITPEVGDSESGVELFQVCTDQDCSQVIGEKRNCNGDTCEEKTFQYASDEHTRTNLFVKATDRQGNTNTVNIGYIETRKQIGDYCESDDECISGNCADSGEYENTCRPPNEPPEVEITD